MLLSRLADEAHGIQGLIVFANLVMNVRAGRTPCAAGVADLIAALDALALLDRDARHMAVARRYPIAVIKNDQVAITRIRPGVNDQAVRRRRHRRAVINGDVEALM